VADVKGLPNIWKIKTGKVMMKEAMADVVKMARDEGKLCYLYYSAGKFEASFIYWQDWIFKAYPGGRKELSLRGKRILEEVK